MQKTEVPFQIEAALSSYKSVAAGGVRLTFDTQLLTADHTAAMLRLYQKTGWLLFAVDMMEFTDVPAQPVEGKTKTPSQRLRAVLFVRWQQLGSKGDFEDYYKKSIEYFIDQIKEKLD
jgi:hypothetical protein